MKDNEIGEEKDKTLSKSLVKYTFQTRFFFSRLTRKSRIIKRIADKVFFEDNELFVLQIKIQLIIRKDPQSLQTLKSTRALKKMIQNLCQVKSSRK